MNFETHPWETLQVWAASYRERPWKVMASMIRRALDTCLGVP